MATGKAQVALAFDNWKEGHVLPTTHEITIVAGKPRPNLEAVSSRLRQSLVHPNKVSAIVGLKYSPDGKRIIAGDYPGGIIQVWNAETGEQLTKLETGYGYRGSSQYFHLTPDWKSILVGRETNNYERIEKDGQRMYRWKFEGNVRMWDLDSGELREVFEQTPRSSIRAMTLSPDGSCFLAAEEPSGDSVRRPKMIKNLWDVRTKHFRALPANAETSGQFSPDGKTLAISFVNDELSYHTCIKLFDVATLQEKLSIPLPSNALGTVGAFSPDTKMLLGSVQVFAKRWDWDHAEGSFKIWDVATGRELTSLPGAVGEQPYLAGFAPDGRTALVGRKGGRFWIIDLTSKQILRTFDTNEKTVKGERLIVPARVFSPDGKWLAVVTRRYPDDNKEYAAEDVPQARIHLIEVATGEVRETLIAPPAFVGCAAFSPDGKTLATGGHGKVLLWDLSKPPGSSLSNKTP